MKRPQGFDGPPALPVDSEHSAVPPARPLAGRRSVSAETSSTGSSESASTAPVTLLAGEAADADARRPARASTPVRDGGGARGPMPSNREIRRSLRQARKERARVERGEVRRFTKRTRRRRMTWLASLGTLAVLVLGVALTAFSPLMALRTIDVTGTSRVDVAAVRKALSDQIGRPLPLVDQAAIRSDLAAFPLIRSYTVESNPPNTIVVRIVERQPIGVIKSGSEFALVDAAKVTIAASAERPAGYPLITATGAAAEDDPASGFAAAANVLASLPASLLQRVDSVSASTADDVSFVLRDGGDTVVWGSADQSDLKAAALSALLKSASGARHFDVSSPHSVTTR